MNMIIKVNVENDNVDNNLYLIKILTMNTASK